MLYGMFVKIQFDLYVINLLKLGVGWGGGVGGGRRDAGFFL